jgi:hypothetical protein
VNFNDVGALHGVPEGNRHLEHPVLVRRLRLLGIHRAAERRRRYVVEVIPRREQAVVVVPYLEIDRLLFDPRDTNFLVNVLVVLAYIGAHIGGHLQFIFAHRIYLLDGLKFNDRHSGTIRSDKLNLRPGGYNSRWAAVVDKVTGLD